jgi:hypothetical protein
MPFELFGQRASRAIGGANSAKLLKLFKLARMIRIGKLGRRMSRMARKSLHLVSGFTKKAVQLLRLLFMVILMMHWIT